MATLTLDASVPYTIKYEISNMTSEYVFSAVVQLKHTGSASIIKVNSHQAINVAFDTNIKGEFIGLMPNTSYTVTSRVYNQQGQETSNQTQTITTCPVEIDADPYCKHSVIISTKNTYDEWGLIPTERPTVKPAEAKVSYGELPGSSESVDYTEMLTGRVAYGQRVGTWTFYFDPDAPKFRSGIYLELKNRGRLWAKIYSDLLNYTHGITHSIVLEDNPDIVYTGRLTVSKWDSSSIFSRISINYNIDPPERDVTDTLYIKLMAQNARYWNAKVNGNINYATWPMKTKSEMAAAGWTVEEDYLKVLHFVFNTAGTFSIMVSPILQSGTVLSTSAMQTAVASLNVFGTAEQLKASDTYGILVAYKTGYDVNEWNALKASLQYYEDQYLRSWKTQNGILDQ